MYYLVEEQTSSPSFHILKGDLDRKFVYINASYYGSIEECVRDYFTSNKRIYEVPAKNLEEHLKTLNVLYSSREPITLEVIEAHPEYLL
jgi:hypothetical protein